jgi:fumarate reductase subunit D
VLMVLWLVLVVMMLGMGMMIPVPRIGSRSRGRDIKDVVRAMSTSVVLLLLSVPLVMRRWRMRRPLRRARNQRRKLVPEINARRPESVFPPRWRRG